MLKRKKIAEEHYQAICDRYQSGESQAQIAKSFDVSHATIGNILKSMDIETRVGGGKFYQDELQKSNAKILEMLEDNWTLTAIAFHENICLQSLYDRIKILGYTPSHARRYGEEIQAIYDAIQVAWQFGLKVREIKERFGVNSDQVARATRNLPRRGKSYWQKKEGKAKAAQYKILYEQGLSMADVAKIVGCDEKTVLRLFHKYCPEIIRTAAQTKKKKSISLQKASNDEIMKDGKYSHIPSSLAINRFKKQHEK